MRVKKEHTNNTQACKIYTDKQWNTISDWKNFFTNRKKLPSNDKIFVLKVSNREIRKETRCGREEWKGNHRKMGRFGKKGFGGGLREVSKRMKDITNTSLHVIAVPCPFTNVNVQAGKKEFRKHGI